MTIYISHSRNFDFQKELYEVLQNSSLAQKYELILPHRDSQDPFLASAKDFNKDRFNLVLAEISYPSTGQGIELGWANINNIPIVCIYKKGQKYTGAINSVSKTILEYSDLADILGEIEQMIAKIDGTQMA